MTLKTPIRDIGEAIEVLQQYPVLAVDLETSGLSPFRDVIAVVQMSAPDGTVAVLHTRGKMPEGLSKLLGSREELVGHNAFGFDACFLARAGVDVWTPKWYDTLMGEAILARGTRVDADGNSKVTAGRSLDDTLKRHLGKQKLGVEDHGSWMNQELTAQQVEYCVQDVAWLHKIREKQWAAMDDGPRRELELAQGIFRTVVRMYFNGLPLDKQELALVRRSAEARLGQAFDHLPPGLQAINLNSSQQLAAALLALGVPLRKRTPTGKLSTDKRVLADLMLAGVEVDLMAALINYGEAAKTLQMYSAAWENEHMAWHSAESQYRVHARYNPYGAATGRYTCSGPNLQQVPREARFMFRTKHVGEQWIVKADYSQIEVRIAAALCQDEALLEAIASSDVHRALAAQMYNIPESEVSKDQRQEAKAASFLLLYGGGAMLLYTQTRLKGGDITRERAEELFERFFTTYPGLLKMRERAYALSRAGRTSLVMKMPTGLVRTLQSYQSGGNGTLDPQTILNTMVQGAAASGLKLGLRQADKAGLWPQLAATVHDEVVAVVDGTKEQAEEYARELERCMIAGMAEITQVPIRVEATVSDRWADPPAAGHERIVDVLYRKATEGNTDVEN